MSGDKSGQTLQEILQAKLDKAYEELAALKAKKQPAPTKKILTESLSTLLAPLYELEPLTATAIEANFKDLALDLYPEFPGLLATSAMIETTPCMRSHLKAIFDLIKTKEFGRHFVNFCLFFISGQIINRLRQDLHDLFLSPSGRYFDFDGSKTLLISPVIEKLFEFFVLKPGDEPVPPAQQAIILNIILGKTALETFKSTKLEALEENDFKTKTLRPLITALEALNAASPAPREESDAPAGAGAGAALPIPNASEQEDLPSGLLLRKKIRPFLSLIADTETENKTQKLFDLISALLQKDQLASLPVIDLQSDANEQANGFCTTLCSVAPFFQQEEEVAAIAVHAYLYALLIQLKFLDSLPSRDIRGSKGSKDSKTLVNTLWKAFLDPEGLYFTTQKKTQAELLQILSNLLVVNQFREPSNEMLKIKAVEAIEIALQIQTRVFKSGQSEEYVAVLKNIQLLAAQLKKQADAKSIKTAGEIFFMDPAIQAQIKAEEEKKMTAALKSNPEFLRLQAEEARLSALLTRTQEKLDITEAALREQRGQGVQLEKTNTDSRKEIDTLTNQLAQSRSELEKAINKKRQALAEVTALRKKDTAHQAKILELNFELTESETRHKDTIAAQQEKISLLERQLAASQAAQAEQAEQAARAEQAAQADLANTQEELRQALQILAINNGLRKEGEHTNAKQARVIEVHQARIRGLNQKLQELQVAGSPLLDHIRRLEQSLVRLQAINRLYVSQIRELQQRLESFQAADKDAGWKAGYDTGLKRGLTKGLEEGELVGAGKVALKMKLVESPLPFLNSAACPESAATTSVREPEPAPGAGAGSAAASAPTREPGPA